MTTLAAVIAAEERFEAGPTALLVVVLLGIGIIVLTRSMLKHLRRVPASFDDDPPETAEPVEETEIDPPSRGTT